MPGSGNSVEEKKTVININVLPTIRKINQKSKTN